MLRRFVRIGCALAAIGAAQPASAQQQPPDPMPGQQGPGAAPLRPLFGGGPGLIDQSLTAGVSFGAGYDVERARRQVVPAGVDPNLFLATGQTAFGNGHLAYSAGVGRVSGGAALRSAAYYYKHATTGLRFNSGASLYANVHLWRGSRVGVRHDITYAPIQLHLLSATEQLDPQGNPYFDPTLVGQSLMTHRTSIDFGQPISLSFSRRLSMELSYAFQAGDRRVFGQSSHSGRAGIVYGITKGLGVRAGYQIGAARFRTSETESDWVSHHNIDMGLNFGRRLSLLRQLSFSFGTGIAAIRDPHVTYYTFTGNARLNWNISQNWGASGGFHRNVQFLDEFQNVAIGNGVNAGIHGLIARRVSFHSTLGMHFFDVAGGTGDMRVRTIHGRVGVSTSLTRFLSLGVDYSNAYHSVGQDVALFPGVPRERNRHGVRAHLSLSAPIFATTRRQ